VLEGEGIRRHAVGRGDGAERERRARSRPSRSSSAFAQCPHQIGR
jgi:hypothetical protein